MPVVEEKPEKAMALLPYPQSEGDQQGEVAQPPARQPSSLHGLFRFAMEATKAEDAPRHSENPPIDGDRRKFLEEALKSLTLDVVELLQRQIQTLKRVDQIEPDSNITDYEKALEIILDHVDHVDIANDFHKIGGFLILFPCLKCSHPRIRADGCELLATLCQNNPYCQRIVLDNEFVPKILTMIEKDNDAQVVLKALYALSSIVRASEEGFNQLIQYNGLSVLLDTLKKGHEKFISKTTFLLTSLCRHHPDLKSRLVFLEYIPVLIQLVSSERSPSHEHVLSLLVSIVEENPTAEAECKSAKYKLKDILHKYIKTVRNKDEYLEEEQYCKRLLHLLFSA